MDLLKENNLFGSHFTFINLLNDFLFKKMTFQVAVFLTVALTRSNKRIMKKISFVVFGVLLTIGSTKGQQQNDQIIYHASSIKSSFFLTMNKVNIVDTSMTKEEYLIKSQTPKNDSLAIAGWRCCDGNYWRNFIE